jgi:branched-chain amino acid transport system ATP-binding protein
LLRLEHVNGGYDKNDVIHDVTINVPESSVVALLGANGAGKSTLLKLISGLVKPTSGTIQIGDLDVTRLPPHRRVDHGICHIIEGRGIFPSLTVRENLLVGAPTRPPGEILQRAAEAFPVLGIRTSQIAGTLSGGEQQMLALTRAYLNDARFILVDEVSLGLAPMLVSTIFEFLGVLARNGTSLLLVEQYVSRALAIADHVYVLNRGRIVMDCPPEEIRGGSKELMDKYLSAATP